MTAKGHWGLVAAISLLASNLYPRIVGLPLHQSGTKVTLDVAKAMAMLYGNYDAKERTSVASLPRNKSSFPAPGEQQMTVRILFDTPSMDKQLFVVTYAIPSNSQSFDCHACAPTIGMAVFTQKGSKWTLDDSNKAITADGEWGKPPTDIRLVQIGPIHHAVEITDVGRGQGETTAAVQLLIPWNGGVNLGLERIVADDDKGACEPNGLPCYANRRTVTFIRKNSLDYYNLQLRLTGTDLPVSDAPASARARSVSGLEMLKFENGKYVQISRVGDLTTVDHAVAKREDLK